ncbi:MAG: NAD(P)H-binding protein [Halioglobus sp.]
MKITLLGSTGNLGQECLKQCLDAGHDVTVLVRNPNKLQEKAKNLITIVEGDALSFDDVITAMPRGTDAILFAIGVDEKTSPQNLCTDVTELVLRAMRQNNIPRLVWCGGGSNLLEEDVITFGAKFLRWYSENFLKHRHTDKEHQLTLLQKNTDLYWLGIRPLQMKHGAKTEEYRLGFNAFSGLSKITFSDCAHAMIQMLSDDTWIGKAPIVQY